MELTPDIVKNIWSGRTKLYKSYFDDNPNIGMNYQEYLEIISKKR